jgi:hypothetical protein
MYKALKTIRYAGVEYTAGDPISALSPRDAKVFVALRKVEECAAQAKPEEKPEEDKPAHKGTYHRRDMRATK